MENENTLVFLSVAQTERRSVEDDLEHHADPIRYHDKFFADVYINDVSITSFHSVQGLFFLKDNMLPL